MKLYAKSKNECCSLHLYEVSKGNYSLMTVQEDGFVVVHANRLKPEVAKFIKHCIKQYNNDVMDEQKMIDIIYGFIGYEV